MQLKIYKLDLIQSLFDILNFFSFVDRKNYGTSFIWRSMIHFITLTTDFKWFQSSHNNNTLLVIIVLYGLSGATQFYIYISYSPLKIFLTFSISPYDRLAHTAHADLVLDFPFIFSFISKYLPLVSKGGWLPPFHTLSSATYEIYTSGV